MSRMEKMDQMAYLGHCPRRSLPDHLYLRPPIAFTISLQQSLGKHASLPPS